MPIRTYTPDAYREHEADALAAGFALMDEGGLRIDVPGDAAGRTP